MHVGPTYGQGPSSKIHWGAFSQSTSRVFALPSHIGFDIGLVWIFDIGVADISQLLFNLVGLLDGEASPDRWRGADKWDWGQVFLIVYIFLCNTICTFVFVFVFVFVYIFVVFMVHSYFILIEQCYGIEPCYGVNQYYGVYPCYAFALCYGVNQLISLVETWVYTITWVNTIRIP